jgi:GT2 family glycosyltransferase
MVEIDIIILSNAINEDLRSTTEQAIESVLASEDPTYILFQIILIESNSKAQPYHYPQTNTIYPNSKFGFHKFLNIGIKNGKAPYICLCNNDLIFSKGWASNILKAMEQDPNLQSASPACSIHHPQNNIPLNSGVYYGYEIRKELVGWCIFLKRNVIKEIGYLDEGFNFWYADNDYAKTLEKHGVKHALVSNAIVDHLESRTLQTKDQEIQYQLTQGSRFYYEYKWENRSYLSYLNWKRKMVTKEYSTHIKQFWKNFLKNGRDK